MPMYKIKITATCFKYFGVVQVSVLLILALWCASTVQECMRTGD